MTKINMREQKIGGAAAEAKASPSKTKVAPRSASEHGSSKESVSTKEAAKKEPEIVQPDLKPKATKQEAVGSDLKSDTLKRDGKPSLTNAVRSKVVNESDGKKPFVAHHGNEPISAKRQSGESDPERPTTPPAAVFPQRNTSRSFTLNSLEPRPILVQRRISIFSASRVEKNDFLGCPHPRIIPPFIVVIQGNRHLRCVRRDLQRLRRRPSGMKHQVVHFSFVCEPWLCLVHSR